MYSAVQGPGSACGPAGREQIQANWIEERNIFNLLQHQVRKDTGGDSFDVQGKLLPQAAPVLFLGLHCVEKREFNDVGPDSRTGASAQTAVGGGKRGCGQCKKKEQNNSHLRQAGQEVKNRAAYLISSNCSSSWLAWKMGLLVKSSPKIHLKRNRTRAEKKENT